ncbi:MAG: sigma-70 family RNA polymerase sigma factor [Patescibacteria group bacterium]
MKKISDKDVAKHLALVKKIVFNIKKGIPANIDVKDMVQDGLIGLMKAFEKYDASRRASFTTYATIKIRGAVKDGLIRSGIESKGLIRKRRTARDAINDIEIILQRKAKLSEIAVVMNLSIAKLAMILFKTQSLRFIPLEKLESPEEDNDEINIFHSNLIYNISPEIQSEKEENMRWLKKAITSSLTADEKNIYLFHFKIGLTNKDIGCIYGVTESRISQIVMHCTQKIKGYLQRRLVI